MRISDWSSDVCSSDLLVHVGHAAVGVAREQIGAQKLILLVGRPRLAGGDDKVAVAAPVALLRLAGGEFAGAHAPRYAGRTIGAARPIALGRPLCRERVCPSGSISVVDVSLKKKNKQ